MITRRAFAAGLLFAAGAKAQTSRAKERGQELVKLAIQALGGDGFLNMQDRLEFGRAYTFYRDRLSGLSVARLYTRYPEPPNPVPERYYGIYERQDFGKKQEDKVLFTPEGGFEVTYRGVRPMADDSVAKHRESTVTNFLYILRQRLHEPGLTFESKGIAVVENRRVEAVDVYDNADRTVTVYLGATDYLPASQRYMRFDNFYKERVEEITRFAKYKDAGGGVMWPLDVQRERDGEKVYNMFSEKVTIGNNFDSGFFELPKDQPMLKKDS